MVAEQYVGHADQFQQYGPRVAVPRLPQHRAVIAIKGDRDAQPFGRPRRRKRMVR